MSTSGAATASPSAGGSALATKPSPRSIAVRIVVLVGIFGVVFGIILPRIVDYGAVRAALGALTLQQLSVLSVLTVIAYVANAGPSKVLVDGLSWPHAVGADLSARAVVSTIPGPTDIATKFVLYRQWSIPADTATAGILFGAFFETLSAMVLPLIAIVGIVVSGHATTPRIVWLAAISVVILVGAWMLIAAIVRSEALAQRIGEGLDWLARHIWGLFRRTPPSGIVDGVLDFRARSKDILTRHGLSAFGAAVVAKLAWFLVLEAAIWAVGISWEVLPPSAVLAAMAIVTVIAFVPITPGAVGVTEMAYIGLLSTVAGPEATGEITAAITLFRIAQWLAPILIGWIVLLVLRRGHWGELLGGNDRAPAIRSP
jgi:putative heme transporter